MDINTVKIDPSALGILSSDQARFYKVLPYKTEDNTLYLYSGEAMPNIENVLAEIEMITSMNVAVTLIDSSSLFQLQSLYYQKINADIRIQDEYYTGNHDNFLNNLINDARSLKSSDIHIESYENLSRVRIRIDGSLVQRFLIDKTVYPILVNKIKILAHLDISEKRLPQDGRILFEAEGGKTDLRVSVIPTLFGEKVVLRLLHNNFSGYDLKELGFSESDLANYVKSILRPNGIILLSGPTGSGKTTTLYATLKLLNKSSKNIITIEDPVEYTMEGINQVQLKENIGLNFAAAMKTFLRQDPDVIMVGEIRDPETANMAIRAALTGHLVLSTIHTNSAWGIVSRLTDMGIAPFLISNTLNTIAAQRLVKLLCPHCKREEAFDAALLPAAFTAPSVPNVHFIQEGCIECYQSGYKGRKAIYEVIPVDEEISQQIKNSRQNIADILKERKIKSLQENAYALFEKGETSLEEIYPLLT